MNIAKNIVTALLALLLANPACCCALGACGSANVNAPAHSCCSSTHDDRPRDENAPDKEHECQCSLNKQYTDKAQTDWVAPAPTLLPSPTFIELPKVSYSPVLSDKPDLSAPPPPSSPVRILFSVFRL